MVERIKCENVLAELGMSRVLGLYRFLLPLLQPSLGGHDLLDRAQKAGLVAHVHVSEQPDAYGREEDSNHSRHR